MPAQKPKTFEQIKKQLLDEQELLISILKTKHRYVYDWLQEHNIDVRALGAYSKNIAVAMAITMSAYNATASTVPTSSEEKESKVLMIQSDRFKEDSPLQYKKAVAVWDLYGDEILKSADKYDVDPRIIFATIMVESGGNTQAIRYEPSINDASYGLGQLLYGTARLIGFDGTPQDLYNPEVNIDLIARYHRRNIDVYGDLSVEQLATAYNAGSPYSYPTYGHVDKFVGWYNTLNYLSENRI